MISRILVSSKNLVVLKNGTGGGSVKGSPPKNIGLISHLPFPSWSSVFLANLYKCPHLEAGLSSLRSSPPVPPSTLSGPQQLGSWKFLVAYCLLKCR